MGVEGISVAYFDDEKNSIVAAYMIMKRGCKIIPIVKKGIDVEKIKKILSKYDAKFDVRDVIGDEDIYEIISDIASKTYSKALILSEGFSDIKFEDKKVEIPVFRPLIGFDDSEVDLLFEKIK